MRRAQATTELLILISVLVIGLMVAAYALFPFFRVGVEELDDDVAELLAEGTRPGSGDKR
jgi:hypothetical protein